MRQGRWLWIAAAALALQAGCAHVGPAERGTLARPEMQFDADPGHVKILDTLFASREAATGGRSTGGGGCGCN